MNTITETSSGASFIANAAATSASQQSTEARGSSLANVILLCWMIGTVFFDKGFAYLRIGPLFITEITLGLLLWSNRRRFRPSDVLLTATVAIYIGFGAIRHGSLMMAYKDLAWLPYLFFLRFFPRNFPEKYVKIVIGCCFLKIIALLTLPVTNVPLYWYCQKYCDGITIMFCFIYMMIKKNGKIGLFFYGVFLLTSLFVSFKTLIVLMLLVPLVMRSGVKWEKLLSPLPMLCFVTLFVTAVMLDYTRIGLVSAVDFLNTVSQLFGFDLKFETGTAVWRAEIWTHALNRLFRDGEMLFGQFPGFNFMDNEYLGINLFLGGGQGLGVVRTAHCIIVQMIMKAGIMGVLLYGYYFFQNVKTNDRLIVFIVLCVFLLAMTADVLEVPSRGPLFYCLLVLLIRTKTEHDGELLDAVSESTERMALPEEEPWNARGVAAISAGRERWSKG